MTQAFVALGSNIEPAARLVQAARALRRRFPDVRFSSCYRSPAFGFDGADFLNAAAGFSTALPIPALLQCLQAIEAECGRGRDEPRWAPRAMDLDLLLYGDCVGAGAGYVLPRPDLTRRAYMLGPLAELAPELRYPPLGPTLQQLWLEFPRGERELERIGLELNGTQP